MFHSNMQLLVFRVTADLYNLHTVQQRAGDCLECVRCCDEHNFREIQRNFQIVVPELSILFTVQHLQQS